MHTAMDKNGTVPESNMGGGQQGSFSMKQSSQPGTASAAMAGQGTGQSTGQNAAQNSGQTNETGYAGHTVLDGSAQTSQQGGGAASQNAFQQGTGNGHNGNAQGAVAPQAGQPQPFAVKFPDNIPVSQDLLDNYQDFCADCGLNNEQAQQAVDFYLKEQTRQMDVEREFSMNILENGAWKGQFDQRLSVANSAVRALDSQLGGRLQPVLEAGLGNNHVFAEMMACVGDLLQEENFIPHTGGSATARSMSTEDFLRNEVFKTR